MALLFAVHPIATMCQIRLLPTPSPFCPVSTQIASPTSIKPQNCSRPLFIKGMKTESNVKPPQGSAISIPFDMVSSKGSSHLPAIPEAIKLGSNVEVGQKRAIQSPFSSNPSQKISHLVVSNAIKPTSDVTLYQKRGL